ncbi:hypothetical protein [Methanospirillum purgamenti]|jgi:hypothetical protein|nr:MULTISPECIES: hypothetical protein [Methanospirillum]MDX8552000.1 hypothetical protein [Methanospirillum hungatei]
MTGEVDEQFKQAQFDITAGYTLAESTTRQYAVFSVIKTLKKH